MTETRGPDEPRYIQNVNAVNGFAYGSIGADIHVFRDGQPLYLLANWRSEPDADPGWLRELPSRMLNARRTVVPFTGRDAELADLRQWLKDGPRLAVRWLYGPGGQGKTRLARQLAAECTEAGWKVLQAFHGPDADPIEEGSQDMSLAGTVGLLIVVDYADRWLLRHITWFLKNALLHHDGYPTRILMVARTTDSMPRIRGILDTHFAATSSQQLAALPAQSGERTRMFEVARDSFAARYQLANSQSIALPSSLESDEFGLTLAVHMAALVAVDASVTGKRAPVDMAGLTVYLLDREQLHWARLYADGTAAAESTDGDYRTPPESMNQVVFTAALTGTLTPTRGAAIVESLGLTDPESVLKDHAVCYPPEDPRAGVVLEPLYPDRLAEDFLALTMPGHNADYPAQLWAPAIATALLRRSPGRQAGATFAPRAITFLASAAQRWPHLGAGCLFPLLRQDPQLAIDAGSAALAALSSIEEMEPSILKSVDALLPESHAELDVGIAALTHRLTEHELQSVTDHGTRARLLVHLGFRDTNAGRRDDALTATEQAVSTYRLAAAADFEVYAGELAMALTNLGSNLSDLGRWEEAVVADEEAVAIRRAVIAAEPARAKRNDDETLQSPAYLAWTLSNLYVDYSTLGRSDDALAAIEEAVAIYRRLSTVDHDRTARQLAMALDHLGNELASLGRRWEALDTTREAVEMRRELVTSDPPLYEPRLAASLTNLAIRLMELRELPEADVNSAEAVTLYRRLATANPAAYEHCLAQALNTRGSVLAMLARNEESREASEEAVALYRKLAVVNPGVYERSLAIALSNAAAGLRDAGSPQHAITYAEEAVSVYRGLARSSTSVYLPLLARALFNSGIGLVTIGNADEAHDRLEEAIRLYRSLDSGDPDAQEYLARSLTTLAVAAAARGEQTEALKHAEEGVRRYRELVAGDSVYEEWLARSLSVLSTRLSALGHADEASAVAAEAAAIRARGPQRRPTGPAEMFP